MLNTEDPLEMAFRAARESLSGSPRVHSKVLVSRRFTTCPPRTGRPPSVTKADPNPRGAGTRPASHRTETSCDDRRAPAGPPLFPGPPRESHHPPPPLPLPAPLGPTSGPPPPRGGRNPPPPPPEDNFRGPGGGPIRGHGKAVA